MRVEFKWGVKDDTQITNHRGGNQNIINWDSEAPVLLSADLEPMRMSPVLSLFSIRELCFIQFLISKSYNSNEVGLMGEFVRR